MANEGLNRVMLLGNLTADTELRSTGSGQVVLKIRLATNESYLDSNRQKKERTDYHQIVVWGKRAEALSRIMAKGDRVFVEGRIQTSSYDKDGVKHYRTEIVASNIILCGGQRGQQPSQTQQAPTSGNVLDDEIYGDKNNEEPFPF